MSFPSSSVAASGDHRDVRFEQLQHWLAGLFDAPDFSIAPASADASFRRYFRVTRGNQTWIAMDAPPQQESMEHYIRIATLLAQVGVNVPRILQSDPQQGFLLNSDLGSTTYLAQINAGGDADRLYADALAALVQIQASAQAAQHLPLYDAAMLRRELALFPEWFCNRHLQLSLSNDDTSALQRVFESLTCEALAQPRVFVHRDYHSRNLMVGDGGRFGANPGILDFQDAVHGPVTYDLVSLLRDCYVAWPIERVHEWVTRFREVARAAGIDTGPDQATFLRWFDLMGVQRHLKAIGIFARLWHRDGKAGYLQDIPRTLNYVRVISAAYPELAFLQQLIDTRILPALERLAPAVAATDS